MNILKKDSVALITFVNGRQKAICLTYIETNYILLYDRLQSFSVEGLTCGFVQYAWLA